MTTDTCISFRHYVTGKYLNKDDSGNVCLVADYMQSGAQWKVHNTQDESLIRLTHSKLLLQCENFTLQAVLNHSGGTELRCLSVEDKSSISHHANVFQMELFDPIKLELMLKVETQLMVVKQLLGVIQQSGDDRELLVSTVAKYAEAMIDCYTKMVIACTNDTETNPFTRDGIPNIPTQRVMAQLGAIGLTVKLLDTILQVPYLDIVDPTSNKAITLLFRFLRQVVKANNVREHVSLMEEHLDFIHKHLNSDYKVVDTLSELIADNASLLDNQVTPEFVSHIADCLHAQHKEKLCGARFVNMLRSMCSLDGNPLVYNQSIVLANSLAHLMELEDCPLSRVKIGKDGMVQITGPTKSATGQYTWTKPKWIKLSQFQARGTKHDGVFEKYLFNKPLRNCTDDEKTLRCVQ